MRITLLVACLWLVTSPLWGKIVFYSHRDGNTEIYTMDSDGSNQIRLTFNKVSDSSPVWSPNGRQIAFHSYRDGDQNREIYIMDADGSNQRNLTRHPASDGYPAWSPNGSQIAFTSNRNAGENQFLDIFVMDADGSNVQQVTKSGFAQGPRWSPDGEWILFMEGEIFTIRPNGTGRWQVSEPKLGADMFLGGWSPNGKKILYKGTIDLDIANSFAVIATLDAQRTKVIKREDVPLPKMPFSSVSFGADGKSILFKGKRADVSNIYRFRLNDGELIQLTDVPDTDSGAHEWNPRLSVPPQQGLLPQGWGQIKAGELFGRRSRD